jgi:hypothetical protein
MKRLTLAMTGLVLVGMTALAGANPSMLPNHPGYPASGEFANDTGQENLTHAQSLLEAAVSEDAHTTQNLTGASEAALQDPQGSGQPPTVQEPNVVITPTVSEATRMPKK